MFYINQQPITTETLIEAVCDCTGRRQYFLDIRDGGIVSITFEAAEVDQRYSTKHFVAIPHLSCVALQKELCTCMESLFGIDEECAVSIDTLIAAPDYDTALSLIEDESLLSGWDCWRGDVAWEFARKWLCGLSGGEDRWEFDCDCEICKVLQKPDATPGDHLEAFTKEERKNKGGTMV